MYSGHKYPIEPLTSHRRGHWFKSGTAHHVSSSHDDDLPIRELLDFFTEK